MTVYYYEANSMAAPFFSDSSSGFVEASTAFEALKKEVKRYGKHLYAMTIKSCDTKPKLLARYFSGKAVATEKAENMGDSILKEGTKIFIGTGKNQKVIDWTKEEATWENFEDN